MSKFWLICINFVNSLSASIKICQKSDKIHQKSIKKNLIKIQIFSISRSQTSKNLQPSYAQPASMTSTKPSHFAIYSSKITKISQTFIRNQNFEVSSVALKLMTISTVDRQNLRLSTKVPKFLNTVWLKEMKIYQLLTSKDTLKISWLKNSQ